MQRASPARDTSPSRTATAGGLDAGEHRSVGTHTDAVVAGELGIGVHSVSVKRRLLGIEAFAPLRMPMPAREWSAEELAALGTTTDEAIATLLGVSAATVTTKRRSLGISAFKPAAPRIEWSAERLAALGTAPDDELASRWGVSPASVYETRRELGIAPCRQTSPPPVASAELREPLERPPLAEVWRVRGVSEPALRSLRLKLGVEGVDGRRRWSPELEARLGKTPDSVLAAELGVSPSAVRTKRWEMGILSYLRRWTHDELDLLGPAPDVEVAARISRAVAAVVGRRRSPRIRAFAGRSRATLR